MKCQSSSFDKRVNYIERFLMDIKQIQIHFHLTDEGFQTVSWLCLVPWQVFLCEGEGCTDNATNILHYNHISLAFLTGFLFATHLPERLAPGSFDYIGERHRVSRF